MQTRGPTTCILRAHTHTYPDIDTLSVHMHVMIPFLKLGSNRISNTETKETNQTFVDRHGNEEIGVQVRRSD